MFSFGNSHHIVTCGFWAFRAPPHHTPPRFSKSSWYLFSKISKRNLSCDRAPHTERTLWYVKSLERLFLAPQRKSSSDRPFRYNFQPHNQVLRMHCQGLCKIGFALFCLLRKILNIRTRKTILSNPFQIFFIECRFLKFSI